MSISSANWLDVFRNNITCGMYGKSPAQSAFLELRTGTLGLRILKLQCRCPAMLADESTIHAKIEDNNNYPLSYWLDRIQCGRVLKEEELLLIEAKLEDRELQCCADGDSGDTKDQEILAATTVALLPAAASTAVGKRAFVTNANTTLILGIGTAVVGGGANKVPVYNTGAAWIIG